MAISGLTDNTNLANALAAKAAYPSAGVDGQAIVKAGTTTAWASMGKVLRVLSTSKADTFTTSSTSLVDVTGLSVTITPSSASNLILVIVCLSLSNNTASGASRGVILRAAATIGAGTATGSRPAGSFAASIGATANAMGPQTMVHLDNPATTSATTYKVQIAAETGTTAQVGIALLSDTDNAKNPRLASSLTILEIAP